MQSKSSNHILIIITLTLITQITTTTFQCKDLQNTTTSQQVWQIMKLSFFDQIFLLTAGSLSLVVMVLGLISWGLYRSFQTPSDIMFAIVVSQFIENSTLVAQAGYFVTLSNDQLHPNSFQTQCFWMGVFNIFGNVLSTFYNIIFCVILAYSMNNSLKGFMFNRFRYHLGSLLITGSIVLILILTSSIGRGLNGICGFRVASRQSTARFVLQILIASICIFSMVKFKSKFPKNEYFEKQSVFGYYYYYMGIFAATQILSSLSFLVSDVMCRYNSSDILQTLHIFYSISICTSTFLSFAIVFLRFSHPLMIIKISRLINHKQMLEQSQKQMSDLESNIEEQDNISWLGCLLQSLKGSQILSFIEGITVAFIQIQRKYKPGNPTPLAFKRNYIFEISEDIVQSFISKHIGSRQSLIVKNKLNGLMSLDYNVVSYCPDVFSSLSCKKQLNKIIRSLDIKKNIKIVKKEAYTNGGKSGQLFFGTYNNHLLFKTVQKDQVECYLQKIKNFYQYFQRQKQTLIVKLLGVFKFSRKDINEEPIYIILMQNITLLPSELNLRVYDIKGSQFNRSTMQQNQIKSKDQKLRKYTLKDKDFKQLQSNIKIHSHFSNDLKKIAKKDIQFLGNLGLIDYSFLIIKREGQKSNNERGLSQIISNQEQKVIYNFGIIDYLESWTLKRKAERVLKTLITNQEVTANSPLNYSMRLIQFLQTIL